MSSYAPILDLARVAAAGTDGPTAIVQPGKAGVGGEKVAEGRPCLLEVERDRDGTTGAIDGTVAVYGANLHNAFTGDPSVVQLFEADPAGTQTVFDCEQIPYAAQANHNNIVKDAGPGGAFLVPGTDFNVSNNGGLLRVTLAVAAAAKRRIEVHRVTPVALLADGAHGIERVKVTGKQLVWALLTYATGALSRTLVGLRALV